MLYGTKIIQRRQEFLKELNDMVRDLHQNISGNRETLQLVYEPSATAEDFAARMEEARVKDLKMGMTSYGPHRVIFLFSLMRQISGNTVPRGSSAHRPFH